MTVGERVREGLRDRRLPAFLKKQPLSSTNTMSDETPILKIYKGDFAWVFGMPDSYTSVLFAFQRDWTPDFDKDSFFLLCEAADAKAPHLLTSKTAPMLSMVSFREKDGSDKIRFVGLDDGVDAGPSGRSVMVSPKSMDYFASVPAKHILHWASMVHRFGEAAVHDSATRDMYNERVGDRWYQWTIAISNCLKDIAQKRIDRLCEMRLLDCDEKLERHPFRLCESLGEGMQLYTATIPAGDDPNAIVRCWCQDPSRPMKEWRIEKHDHGMALVHFREWKPDYCIDASFTSVKLVPETPIELFPETPVSMAPDGEVVAVAAKPETALSRKMTAQALYAVERLERNGDREYYLVVNDDGEKVWISDNNIASVATT